MPLAAASERAPREWVYWIVLVSLAGRVLTTLADVGPALLLGGDSSGLAPRLALTVGLLDAVLIIGVATGHLEWLLRARWFFVADVTLAVTINLWVTAYIPARSFWEQGNDPLGAYLAGTVALWAVIRGLRTGVALFILYMVVVIIEASRNGAPFNGFGWLAFGDLLAWALVSVATNVSVVMLARRATRLARIETGERTRLRALIKLHGTVLQALARIGSITGSDGQPDRVLEECRWLAAEQATAARVGVAQFGLAGTQDLRKVVIGASTNFARPSFRVNHAIDEAFQVPADVADVVAEAIKEALTNAAKHAGVAEATVRLTRTSSGAEIHVADAGRGIVDSGRGFGLQQTIVDGLTSVGGAAHISSRAGQGTDVRMDIPAAPSANSTDRAVDWFVLVPVLLRVAVMVAALLGAPLALSSHASDYVIIVGLIVVANVALLAAIAAGRGGGLLSASAFFVLDLAVAVALVLWTASILPAGTAAELTLVSTTIYLVPTVPMWGVVRGLRTGVWLLVASFGLELASAAVNGVPLDGGSLGQVLTHFLQVPAAFLLAVLVMRLARQDVATALAQERGAVLRDMAITVSTALDRIVELSTAPPTAARVREVHGVALVTGDVLDQKLRAESRGLEDRLTTEVRACRRRGVDVRLQLVGPPDDLPALVIDAVIDAVRVVLTEIVIARSPTAVAYAGQQGKGLLMTIRDYNIHPYTLDTDQVSRIVNSIGGAAEFDSPDSGGTLVTLTWPAP